MKKVLTAVLIAVVLCAAPGISQAFTINLAWDWFCNGFNEGYDGSTTVFLNNNGTFTDGVGNSGTWGTRMVKGKGIAYLSFDVGCHPLYSIDLTTGEIIYDCRDGSTLVPNSWPNAQDYSCARTRAYNRLVADPEAGGTGDPSGAWLSK